MLLVAEDCRELVHQLSKKEVLADWNGAALLLVLTPVLLALPLVYCAQRKLLTLKVVNQYPSCPFSALAVSCSVLLAGAEASAWV